MASLMTRPAVVNAISDAAVAARDELDRLIMALRDARLPLENEKALQAALYESLHVHGIRGAREVQLFAPNGDGQWPRALGVIDVLTSAGVGLEVKIKGSAADAVKQIERYAESDDVIAFGLVTSKPMAAPPRTKNGKRIVVIDISRGWL